MLSIAAASSTAFSAPSAMAVRSTRTNVMMQEAAPVEEVVVIPPFDSKKFAESLPGITGPLGFFDPLGFCTSGDEKVSEAKIRFHPLFATDDAPSFMAFQQTPLQTFWPVVVGVIAIAEVFSVFTFQNPASYVNGEPAEPWTMRLDHQAGDLGFDPMGLKPTDPKEFAEMQTKELNNGRLAMIAIAGMVVQEGITGAKLF